ncbi:MAG: methionyl-tRNA formyltransferase [Ferruginibacter sp.]
MDIKPVIVICNNEIAVPALKELLFFKQVAAVGIPQNNSYLLEAVRALSMLGDTPVVALNKKDWVAVLSSAIQQYQCETVLMMTFPFKIPATLLKLPLKGFINFHYGRLPQHRGAAPIFSQVATREQQPGISIHVVTENLDAGPIIMHQTVPYNANDTFGILAERLADVGAKLVTPLMKILSFGSIIPALPQQENEAVYHEKPNASNLMLNWKTMDAAKIRALVLACNPWNKGCGATIKNNILVITEINEVEEIAPQGVEGGTIINIHEEHGIRVATVDGLLLDIAIIYTENGIYSSKWYKHLGLVIGDKFE